MKQKQILEITLKLSGIYFFSEAIFPFLRILTYLLGDKGTEGYTTYFIWTYGIDFFILFSLAIFFIFWSDSIANLIYRKEDEEIKFHHNKFELFEIAILIIGILLIINSISYLIPLFFENIYFQNENKKAFLDTEYSINPYMHIIKFIIGLLFLFKARLISKLIFRKDIEIIEEEVD